MENPINFNSINICEDNQNIINHFNDLIKFQDLEDFSNSTDHIENLKLIVGCFINIGNNQIPNLKLREDSLKKLRVYLKYDQPFFFDIFTIIENSLYKNLLTDKSISDLKKHAYIIFYDFISKYESFDDMDNLNIFEIIFKILCRLILERDNNDQDHIPKILMNFISKTLFFPEIYSKILLIANSTNSKEFKEIQLKILNCLVQNTPKNLIFELVDWNDFFNIFFERENSDLYKEKLYVDLFLKIIEILGEDFYMRYDLDKILIIEIIKLLKIVK